MSKKGKLIATTTEALIIVAIIFATTLKGLFIVGIQMTLQERVYS